MTVTQKLMLVIAVLVGLFAVMTVSGGAVEASTKQAAGTPAGWQMELDAAPQAAIAKADVCTSSTTFDAPGAVTAVGIETGGLLGGSDPQSGGSCQTVVECTLTHWVWYCVAYIVCP